MQKIIHKLYHIIYGEDGDKPVEYRHKVKMFYITITLLLTVIVLISLKLVKIIGSL